MKKVIGIVAEYNPFHEGHAFHIQQSRKAAENAGAASAPGVVICVMSGDFVQRGEWAIRPKALRAQEAVRGGADLVVELPLPWSLASAERFASGAVSLLRAMGITHLSFGSESADLPLLFAAAEKAVAPGFADAFTAERRLHPELTDARLRAQLLGLPDSFGPNDTLALEYLKALQGSGVQPIAVQRCGNGHDSSGAQGFLSASEIRRRIYAGELAGPSVAPQKLELAALARLRMLPADAFENLPDCGGGLGNRLARAVREGTSLQDICDRAKSKRFTYAAVRRAAMCAALGVTRFDAEGMPGYLRVLAFNDRGQEYLHSCRGSLELPLILRARDVNACGEQIRHIFSLTSGAHDFLSLGYGTVPAPCGEDFRYTPRVQESIPSQKL